MKVIVRFTTDEGTFVARKGFDFTPTRKQIDAVVDDVVAQARLTLPKKAVSKTKA